MGKEYALYDPRLDQSVSSCKYSLSSAVALRRNGRNRPAALDAAASSSSSESSEAFEVCQVHPWPKNDVDMDPHALPSINPSDHVKTLLSQLLSSISAVNGAFAHLQATLRTSARGSNTLPTRADPAGEVMAEELQRLSGLYTRLSSVLRNQLADVVEHPKGSSETACLQEYNDCKCKEKPLLRSYEGIISRFYEEIGKKDAVIEALKQTLAKSMLHEEKLEKHIESLEAKLIHHR